ncbi:MMPL family transporter [Patulibacter americanus]|uniref:MMPL family transporter n=1 Tax=Patulibacter americanus TaxID=588672 RepID=UPI0003B47BB1|nr:MMPL family transporter [Patulibacter americanus]
MNRSRRTRPPAAPPTPSAEPAPRGIARAVAAVSGASARRPKRVVALWLLLVVACIVGGAMTGTRSLTAAEQGIGESGRANTRLAGSDLRTPASETVLIRTGDAATTTAVARDLRDRLDTVRGVGAIEGPFDSGRRAAALTTDGGRVALVQVTMRGDPATAKERVEPVQAAVGAVARDHPGARLQQAGSGSLDREIDAVVAADLKRAELISLPLTLVILVVAFGALVAASVPLLLGVTAVAAAMGALGAVSQLVPSGDTTGSLVVLIGLAVGVDYSLFYVRREREERRAGRGPEAALRAASSSVGRAILVSGVTVMVALAGLLLTGIPAFTSMAVGTILVVAIALLGSLTVLPATLALLGDRVDRGRLPFVARRRDRRRAAAAAAGAAARPTVWGRMAGAVTRRPAVALIASTAVLLAIAAPALNMRTAESGIDWLPQDRPTVAAQVAIERAFPGAPDDARIVVTGTGLDGAGATARLAALGTRAARATGGRGPVDVRVARDGRTALVSAPMPDRGHDAADATLRRLRDDVAPTAATVVPGARALVTGTAAESADFNAVLAAKLPLVLGFVLGLAFLLLLAVFRSPRLAGAVVGLNLLSVGAAYGAVVAVFQGTWAEGLLGFTSSGSIVAWFPLVAFVILFGLSMDYSVLVLERMREARIAGRSPREAAAEGIAATAGTVTSAAVVMVAVFAIFATLGLLELKQLGVGLSVAIFVDATIVRGVALPAAVTLLGERAFRLPRARRDRGDRRRAPVAWDDAAPVPAVAAGPTDADAR